MSDRQLFYFDPKVVDLAKLREEAQKAAKGDGRTAPVRATIHYHSMPDSCIGKEHEYFEPSTDS